MIATISKEDRVVVVRRWVRKYLSASSLESSVFLLPREVPRSTHLVFYRVGSNSLRFRLRCVAPLSPLCQRPLTSSTRFLLLLLLLAFLPPPSPAPPLHRPNDSPRSTKLASSFFPRRQIATMALICRFSPRAISRMLLCRVVTWSLGYLVTRLPRC